MNINFSQKRFGYTYGDELYTSGDQSYIGFFNTLSGEFYTGRDITSSSTKLSSKDKIETDFVVSEYFKDRVIANENLSLPYSTEELLVPPNEFITYTAFSQLMQRIHKNTIYLYSKLFIASNDLPSGETKWAGISADIDISTETGEITAVTSSGEFEFKYHNGKYIADTVNSFEIGLPDLDLIRKIQTVNTESNNNIIFGITSNKLITLSSNSDFSTITVSSSSSNVDNNTRLKFKDISDISIYDNKCYIADNNNSIIYKYDISSFLFDNPDNQKLFLEESVGGAIDRSGQKFVFGEIRSIDVSKSKIFIQDSHNRVRILDKNFSWITDLIIPDGNIIAFKYNEFHDFLLIAGQDNIQARKYFMFVTIDSANINLSEKYYSVLRGATIERIKFSSENSNVFYVAIDDNIYKYFVSNIQDTIGEWRLENLGINFRNIWNYIDKLSYNQITSDWESLNSLTVSDNNSIISVIKDFDIIPEDDKDRILAVGNAGALNFIPGVRDRFGDIIYEAPIRIASMLEKTTFDTILTDNDINTYKRERIGSGLDEYVSALTINKEIYKQAYSLFKFVQLIKGRFVGEIDDLSNGSLIYKQYEYTSLDNIIEDFDVNNLYIHENEHLSYNNINRCLAKLYSLQESILNAVNTRVKNLSPN